MSVEPDEVIPDAGPDPGRTLGPWALTRLGKPVVRPGGEGLTRWLLDTLRVGAQDHVVELAAGRTGLPDACATVVYGEATLTMQPDPAKRRVVAEARRLLAAGGRYGIHELCLRPDDLNPATAAQITADLGECIKEGAWPLTVPGWRGLLEAEGFRVVGQMRAPMHLIEPRRLIADEGWTGVMHLAVRAARDRATRKRVLQMRRVFRHHSVHLGAIALIADAV